MSAADITHKKDKLYIELDYSAEKVISRDERINVISIKPYICMEINTKDAKGREQHVVFGGVNDV